MKKVRRVFLSASIPLPTRNANYYATADVIGIRDAIRALVMVIAQTRAELVFGGHPAITPMVRLQMAQTQSRVRGRIVLFQSRYFVDVLPEDNAAFERVVLVNAVEGNRDRSLELMRKEMLRGKFSCGIFVGGMEGVQDEFKMFKQMHAKVPAYPIASTGAAAASLFEQEPDICRAHPELRSELSYLTLMRQLVG